MTEPMQFTVTKSRLWRGTQEQFANVWHYNVSAGESNDTLTSLLDAIVAKEKEVFGTNVTFVQGRVNGPTNQGEALNVMRVIKDLSGAGSYNPATASTTPGESAGVCSFYVGRNPATGRKRFLRKYLHLGRIETSVADIVQGNTALDAAIKTRLKNWYESMKNMTVGASTFPICTPQGDQLPLLTPGVVLDYLHTRQLKQ